MEVVAEFLLKINELFGSYPYMHIGDDYSAYRDPEFWDGHIIPALNKFFSLFKNFECGWYCDGAFTKDNIKKVNEIDSDLCQANDEPLVREAGAEAVRSRRMSTQ